MYLLTHIAIFTQTSHLFVTDTGRWMHHTRGSDTDCPRAQLLPLYIVKAWLARYPLFALQNFMLYNTAIFLKNLAIF